MKLATPSAEDRLQRALKSLIHGTSHEAPATVTELCRRAGVSRNSLYRYHEDVLKALRRHQCRATHTSAVHSHPREPSASRSIDKLAALIEHYYRAYRETLELLERRDRELAELRRAARIKPAVLKS